MLVVHPHVAHVPLTRHPQPIRLPATADMRIGLPVEEGGFLLSVYLEHSQVAIRTHGKDGIVLLVLCCKGQAISVVCSTLQRCSDGLEGECTCWLP